MTPDRLADLVHLRRARDFMDRHYAQPLDVPAMARAAFMSPAHFSRKFRAAYGEPPYSYLMTRRIERAQALLRGGMTVTDTCMAVGCTSLGSFSSRFTEIVGETPSQYRTGDHSALEAVPSCLSMIATRTRRSPGTAPMAPGRAAGVGGAIPGHRHADRTGTPEPVAPSTIREALDGWCP